MATANGRGTGPPRASRRFRRVPAPRSPLEELFHGARERWEDLLVVADNAESSVFEHRRILVDVDRDDRFRARAADQVLARSGDPDGDVQVRRDSLAGL